MRIHCFVIGTSYRDKIEKFIELTRIKLEFNSEITYKESLKTNKRGYHLDFYFTDNGTIIFRPLIIEDGLDGFLSVNAKALSENTMFMDYFFHKGIGHQDIQLYENGNLVLEVYKRKKIEVQGDKSLINMDNIEESADNLIKKIFGKFLYEISDNETIYRYDIKD